MREKLNENPIAQVALVAVLVVAVAVLFIGQSGGGKEESAPTEATAAVAGSSAVGTATGSSPGEAVEGAVTSALESGGEAGADAALASVPTPPPPRPVTAAYEADKTVVLLIVHGGGIDDRLVRRTTEAAAPAGDVALFVVPVGQIARYAAITVGLEVNRVPALIVIRPKRLSKGTPQASVAYGFQTSQSVLQAIRDAAYNGPEATYHPN
jgi:hypothetical protein